MLTTLSLLVLPLAASAPGGPPSPASARHGQAVLESGPGWTEVRFEPLGERALRPGYGLLERLPETVSPWIVDELELALYDLDGDGQLTPGGRDAVGLADSPYFVLLPEVLLIGRDQYRLTTSHEQLFFEPVGLALDPELVADAAYLNELRLRAGRRPCWIDSGVSRDCDAHVGYLEANQLNDQWYNPSTTIERPGWAGKTKGGDAAARHAIYAFGQERFRDAITQWSRMAYHAALLFDPRSSAIGVAHRANVSMLRHFHANEISAVATWPVDGATDVWPSFAEEGERPNPVPGSLDAIGYGTPIIAHLPELYYRRLIEDFSLRELDEDGLPFGPNLPAFTSAPMRAANPYWAQNYGCAMLIPTLPLQPGRGYRASLRIHGFPEPLRWSFTTAGEAETLPAFLVGDPLEGAKPASRALDEVRFDPPLRGNEELGGRFAHGGWQVEFGRQQFYFVDLNGDGRLTVDGRDALGLEGVAHVVPLGPRLLTEEGQLRIDFEEDRITYRVERLELPKKLVAAAALMTRLRLLSARRPVVLDVLASHHADLHARYLAENDMNDGSAALEVHHERPGKPGYTAAGARAAAAGLVACGSSGIDFALWNWFTSAYHRELLIAPDLEAIGVAYHKRSAVLVPSSSREDPQLPFPHPPAGAIEVPRRFSRDGEVPNPLPGTKLGKGAGYPVLVRLPRADFLLEVERFELRDEEGQPVECAVSSPAEPANLLRPQNAGCAFLIPLRPLAAGTTYTAEFAQAGRTVLRWSFTTEK